MFNLNRWMAGTGALLLGCAALAGCAPKTSVSATGSAPAQYTHMFVTTQEVWFNTSATAAPADTSWTKFPLSTPVTVDLLTASGGTLAQLTSGLSLAAGTYAQMRLLPVDSSSSLLASASSAGAIYNSEVDYLDSAGTAHQTPLELENPAEGIGIPASFTVLLSASGGGTLGATSTTMNTGIAGTSTNLFGTPTTNTGTSTNLFGTPTTNTGTSTNLFGNPITSTATSTNLFGTPGTTTGTGSTSTNVFGTTGTTGTTGTSVFGTPATTTNTGTSLFGTTGTTSTATTGTSVFGTTGTTGTTAAAFSIVINFDGSRDLAPFTYATPSVPGVMLNPHLTAYAASEAGAIQGVVTISGLTNVTNATTGRTDIAVTAESLSADGTRHVPVNTAQVNSDGTFVLYPLPASSSSTLTYDLVIHGPGIATMIIQSVPVNVGSISSTTPVSIGTVVPRAATTFSLNLTPAVTPLQAGALVGFYQTLPGTGQVPYLIEERPIDAFNRTFTADQAISAGTIDFGAFVPGAGITVSSATPVEGAGTYRVSATAPLFSDGPLTTSVTGKATSRALVTLPALGVAPGAVANSLSVAVSAVAGKYNQGYLIVSHDGAVVTTTSLATVLAQGGTGTITLTGLPGGTASSSFAPAIYYVSVRAWNSTDPSTSLSRQAYSLPADLSRGSVTGFAASID